MINEKDLNSISLSTTKKDFYQLWDELLETAGKISERWDPTSTNETDPGIVLLKVLTAVADKLNYNIDKNILEAFMPTAAQADSMASLCEMMGYAMKYYRSAETDVTFSYTGDITKNETALPTFGLTIPKFTVITNADKDIFYLTKEEAWLTNDNTTITIPCIEGQIVMCESDTDNIITLASLDDDQRYYLPEIQVAENGIFIYNISDNNRSAIWEKVDNLNTHPVKSKIFKFGYDTKEQRPYIQFPEDIGQLIEDGLEIYYVRSSGLSGNISARTLSSFDKPSTEDWDAFADSENFVVTNTSAVVNGANPETITEAYQAFKKTVGTFDTLITCRDYMNKIYSLVDDQNTNLVSNVIVSDIRDDLNRAQTIYSFNDYGICYLDTINPTADELTEFDLLLYPFKTYGQTGTRQDYVNSFKYSEANIAYIQQALGGLKTISHNFKYPTSQELVCIKNYLKLNAKISTATKVSAIEEASIINNIKTAIYNTFNMHEVDFGEAIPFEAILACIEKADVRIKNVALEEPVLYTKFVTKNGTEYDIASIVGADTRIEMGKILYNKLALKNIMAGKVDIFNRNTSFATNFADEAYGSDTYKNTYPQLDNNGRWVTVDKLVSHCDFDVADYEDKDGSYHQSALPITLGPNEVIKFRAPNFKTTKTFPAYVNYFIHLNEASNADQSIPATFMTLMEFMCSKDKNNVPYFVKFANSGLEGRWLAEIKLAGQTSAELVRADITEKLKKYGALFTRDENNKLQKVYILGEEIELDEVAVESGSISSSSYFVINFYGDYAQELFIPLVNFLKTVPTAYHSDTEKEYLQGLYRQVSVSDLAVPIGSYVDISHIKYQYCTQWHTFVNPLESFYVQRTFKSDELPDPSRNLTGHTKNGLGLTAEIAGIAANEEYRLKIGEYLLINYTKSSDAGDANARDLVVNEAYGSGTIIKPNFKLQDSNTNTKLYAKETGFDFTGKLDGVYNPSGMYSLGAQEQIEIRELSKVELSNGDTYLYWILNNESNSIDINTCTNSYPGSGVNAIKTYILQDGEYIYYTNRAKQDYAFYGAGTEVILHGSDLSLTPSSDFVSTTSEAILENGLSAVPWQCFNLSKTTRYIEFQEYQYNTLVEGDTLLSLHIVDAKDNHTINNDWKTCDSSILYPIQYIRGEDKFTLPKFAVDEIGWQVRSLLEFNVGPDLVQTLERPGDHIELWNYVEYENPEENEYRRIIDLVPEVDKPLSLRASKYLCVSTDTVNTRVYTTNISGETVADTAEANLFKVKLFKAGDLRIKGSSSSKDGELLSLHNMSNRFTKLAMANLVNQSLNSTTYKQLQLHIDIPENNYGLMMLYYIPEEEYDDKLKNAGIIFKPADSVPEETFYSSSPVIFNNLSINKYKEGLNSGNSVVEKVDTNNISEITPAMLESYLTSGAIYPPNRMMRYQGLFDWWEEYVLDSDTASKQYTTFSGDVGSYKTFNFDKQDWDDSVGNIKVSTLTEKQFVQNEATALATTELAVPDGFIDIPRKFWGLYVLGELPKETDSAEQIELKEEATNVGDSKEVKVLKIGKTKITFGTCIAKSISYTDSDEDKKSVVDLLPEDSNIRELLRAAESETYYYPSSKQEWATDSLNDDKKEPTLTYPVTDILGRTLTVELPAAFGSDGMTLRFRESMSGEITVNIVKSDDEETELKEAHHIRNAAFSIEKYDNLQEPEDLYKTATITAIKSTANDLVSWLNTIKWSIEEEIKNTFGLEPTEYPIGGEDIEDGELSNLINKVRLVESLIAKIDCEENTEEATESDTTAETDSDSTNLKEWLKNKDLDTTDLYRLYNYIAPSNDESFADNWYSLMALAGRSSISNINIIDIVTTCFNSSILGKKLGDITDYLPEKVSMDGYTSYYLAAEASTSSENEVYQKLDKTKIKGVLLSEFKDVELYFTENTTLVIQPVLTKIYFNADPFVLCKAALKLADPKAETDEYKLRPGLNIVQFNYSGDLTLTPDISYKGMLIFSDLNLIVRDDVIYRTRTESNGGIDLSLAQYQSPNVEIPAEVQLLADMWAADPNLQFLYGIEPDKTRMLDLNKARLTSGEAETLATPNVWYDADNECNKFVISEIDATYLDTGIQLTRSSKK